MTYIVQEQRPISGGITTAVGQNEGSLVRRRPRSDLFIWMSRFTVFQCTNLSLPNLFGRGEKFGVDYSYSNRGNTDGKIYYALPTQLDPNKQ